MPSRWDVGRASFGISVVERTKTPAGAARTDAPWAGSAKNGYTAWWWCLTVLLLVEAVARASGNGNAPAAAGAIPRTRVAIVADPGATAAFRPQVEVVRNLVNRGITNITGKASSSDAWLSLVNTRDVVGIKVFSSPGPNSGTRPAVVAAVVEELLTAGLPPTNIVVWDRHATDLRLAGFFDLVDRYGIQVVGSVQAGYDEKVFYDSSLLGNLVWGDVEFGKKGEGVGRKSYVSKLVSRQLTKIINLTPLLNHNEAGVSGSLYSLVSGSVDNFVRFESDSQRLATAVPEIYALPALSDHVVLNIVDALVCQYEGGDRGLLHYSTTLNQLRFSRDPVALDALSLQELQLQRESAHAPTVKVNFELYSNAALLELGQNDVKRIQVDQVP